MYTISDIILSNYRAVVENFAGTFLKLADCEQQAMPKKPNKSNNNDNVMHIPEHKIYINYGGKKEVNSATLTKEVIDALTPIKSNYIVRDQDNRVAIQLWKGQLLPRDTRDCMYATQSLIQNVRAQKKERPHIGEWRHYRDFITPSQDYINARDYYTAYGQVPIWKTKAMQTVVRTVDKLFYDTDRRLRAQYAAVKAPLRLFGKCFLMAVFNKGGTEPHYDDMDEMEGLCCVVPMGNYSGGDLVFREHNLRFCIEPGDVIFFRSRDLLHENLPHTGERYSIVFTSHHNSFTEYGQTVQRTYTYHKQKPVASALKYEKQGLPAAVARALNCKPPKQTQTFKRKSRR